MDLVSRTGTIVRLSVWMLSSHSFGRRFCVLRIDHHAFGSEVSEFVLSQLHWDY